LPHEINELPHKVDKLPHEVDKLSHEMNKSSHEVDKLSREIYELSDKTCKWPEFAGKKIKKSRIYRDFCILTMKRFNFRL
jgi:uncharacterized coiled-coil DUF342 family protein